MFDTIMKKFKLTWRNWRWYDMCTHATFRTAL